jgi:hypothetical protein
MRKFTKAEITKRLGYAPEDLEFKGQAYDAGPGNPQRCQLTGGRVRYCFTIKPLSGQGRITIGVGAFEYLRRWNGELYTKLVKGREWLMIMVNATDRDIRKSGHKTARQTTEAHFKMLRTTAKARLQQHRHSTGKEWMPEALFNLNEVVSRTRPMFKYEYMLNRWLGKQVVDLEAALALSTELKEEVIHAQ